MCLASVQASLVLGLGPELTDKQYRQLLRNGGAFTTYNFREYARRRTRDAFREHAAERDPARVQEFLAKGKKELEVLRRQAIVSGFFSFDKLVIEKHVRFIGS